MPVYKKTDVDRFLYDLDDYHQKLKDVLSTAPNPDLFNLYSHNPNDFARDYVEIDLDELYKAIEFHKVIVKSLTQLKKRQAPKLHQDR